MMTTDSLNKTAKKNIYTCFFFLGKGTLWIGKKTVDKSISEIQSENVSNFKKNKSEV